MAILDLNVTLDLAPFRLRVAERIELSGITAIVGASGSGKTTLLRIIAGLEHRAGGRVALDSAVWQDAGSRLPTHRRGVGYVFQDGALFEHLSVRSNLNFPLRFKRHSGSGIAFEDVVAALALTDLLNRRPPTLSGGERQRVAIARALLSNPALLLMDEPVSSIDAARRRQIIDLIADLPDRFGIPVIYVTHDFTELMRLANRAILLTDGKVAATGDVRTVARHADFSTDAFIRDAGSILETTVESHSARMTILRLHDQMLKIPLLDRQVGSAVRIRIPARDVVIALERPNLISIRNALATTIATVTKRNNGMCDVQLRLGDQSLIARVTHEASEELALRGELQVFALIKSVAIDDGVGI